MLAEPSAAVQAELARRAGASFLKRLRFGPRDRRVDILPGVPADAPEVLRMKGAVADELLRRLPRDRTRDGLFTDTGVTGQWQRVRNLAGYAMEPAGTPTGQQADDVPRRFYSAEDEALFRYICRVMTRAAVPAAFAARRMASTGHPHYTRDLDAKLMALLNGARALQDPRLGRALARGDLRAWADQGVYLVSTKASRAQPDAVTWHEGRWTSKPREVTDWRGVRRVADKRLDLGGRLPHIRQTLGSLADEHVRSRERIAYAISYPINAANLTAAAGIRAAMFLRYPTLLHHRDPAEQESRQPADLPFAVTMDMKNFDQQQALMMIDAFIEELPLVETAQRALKLLVRCPVFVNADIMGQRGGRWLGNPLDAATYSAEHGNISGWVWNDILNACVGTFVSVLALRHVGVWRQVGAWQREVDSLLEARHPRARINNKGDDTIIWLAAAETRAALQKLLAQTGRPVYFVVELEDGAQFLGSVLVRAGGGRIRFLPNLASYLNNLLVTEYSAGSEEKPYASYGYFQRQVYYGQHPLFGLVDEVLERQSAKHLRRRLSDIATATMVAPPLDAALQNYATYTFMTNPSSIHYKVDASDLPRAIYEQFFFSIEAERAWPLFGAPLLDPARAEIISRADFNISHQQGANHAA